MYLPHSDVVLQSGTLDRRNYKGKAVPCKPILQAHCTAHAYTNMPRSRYYYKCVNIYTCKYIIGHMYVYMSAIEAHGLYTWALGRAGTKPAMVAGELP